MRSILLLKKLLGLVEMTSGLVNVSFSLPEWQAVKMIFFAPCRVILMCLFWGRGAKGSLGGGGGGLLFMVFHLVWGARYHLGHCPVCCSSCIIHNHLFHFLFFLFSLCNVFYIFMYLLSDNMQQIQ